MMETDVVFRMLENILFWHSWSINKAVLQNGRWLAHREGYLFIAATLDLMFYSRCPELLSSAVWSTVLHSLNLFICVTFRMWWCLLVLVQSWTSRENVWNHTYHRSAVPLSGGSTTILLKCTNKLPTWYREKPLSWRPVRKWVHVLWWCFTNTVSLFQTCLTYWIYCIAGKAYGTLRCCVVWISGWGVPRSSGKHSGSIESNCECHWYDKNVTTH
jgi:hypothetical protein